MVLPTLSPPQLWKGRSDPVLHIELRRWADLMVVAPLDANTLAKVANGICDNLLVSNWALPATAPTPQDCLTLPSWDLGASAASQTVTFACSAPPSSARLSLPQHDSPAPSLSFSDLHPFPLLGSVSLSSYFPVPALCLPCFFWRVVFLSASVLSLSLAHTNKHSLTFEFLYIFSMQSGKTPVRSDKTVHFLLLHHLPHLT